MILAQLHKSFNAQLILDSSSPLKTYNCCIKYYANALQLRNTDRFPQSPSYSFILICVWLLWAQQSERKCAILSNNITLHSDSDRYAMKNALSITKFEKNMTQKSRFLYWLTHFLLNVRCQRRGHRMWRLFISEISEPVSESSESQHPASVGWDLSDKHYHS